MFAQFAFKRCSKWGWGHHVWPQLLLRATSGALCVSRVSSSRSIALPREALRGALKKRGVENIRRAQGFQAWGMISMLLMLISIRMKGSRSPVYFQSRGCVWGCSCWDLNSAAWSSFHFPCFVCYLLPAAPPRERRAFRHYAPCFRCGWNLCACADFELLWHLSAARIA